MSIKIMTEVWASSTATGTKRLMMLALADHANDEGCCFPSVIGLATKCVITERNTQLILRDLEASGELVTEVSAGRGHKNLYWVLPPLTQTRLLVELATQLEKVKSNDEKVKISALLEKVKSSAERVKSSAQKVKPSAEKVKPTSPEPSVTVKEPSEEPSEGESIPATPAVSAEDQDQDTSTGAADAAGANTPTSTPVQVPVQPTANAGTPNATSSKNVPPAAGPVENPVDNFPDKPAAKFLIGYFGPRWLGELIEEDSSRRDWFDLPVEIVQACKDDAVTETKGKKWKGPLIGLLEAEAANARRARRAPTRSSAGLPASSISDQINARIAATRRTE